MLIIFNYSKIIDLNFLFILTTAVTIKINYKWFQKLIARRLYIDQHNKDIIQNKG